MTTEDLDGVFIGCGEREYQYATRRNMREEERTPVVAAKERKERRSAFVADMAWSTD